MSRNEVRVRASVDDKASRPITDLRNAFKTLQNEGAKGVAAGISAAATIQVWNLAAGAIRGVADAVGDSVRGAIEEEASIRRLNLAISENDSAWDGNLDRVNDIIESRQKLGFADDEQRDSLSKLVSVTGDVNKALDLQRTAMDLARLRGMDLATAGDLLGKVYAGNTGILSRYGIQLAKGTSATAALAEIQRRSAGQADAYGETTAGAMEAAGIAVDNLKEDFGKLLLGPLTAAAKFLVSDVIPAIRGVADEIGEIARQAQEAAGPVADLWAEVGKVVEDAEKSTGIDFGSLFGGFEWTDFLPGGSIAAPMRRQREAAEEEVRLFKLNLADIGEEFLKTIPAVDALSDAFKEAFDVDPVPLEDNFAGMFDTLLAEAEEKGRDLPRVFADGIVSARNAPLDAMAELKELMKKPLTETAETARLLGQLASEELAKGLTSGDPAVRNAAAGARNTIINRLRDLEVTPGTISAKGMEALQDAMRSADPEIRAAAAEIYASVKGAVPTPASMFKWSKAALESYGKAFYAMAPELEQAAIAAMHGVKNVMEAHSPPKAGPLKDIDKWGKATGLAWVEGFIDSLGTAEELTKLKLGGVKGAFAAFLKDYGGISGLLGSAGPEMSRERLTEYLGNLNKQLEGETDPAERLRILQQIAEYTERLNRLQGQTNTATEDDVETLMGYLDNLNKALLTEKDPEKRAALIAKWVLYYQRMQALQNPAAAPAGVPAGADQVNSAASGGQYVQTSPGAWEWQADSPAAGGASSAGAADDQMPTQIDMTINVNVQGSVVDPNSSVAYQIAEVLVPAIRRVFSAQNLKTADAGDPSHAHGLA